MTSAAIIVAAGSGSRARRPEDQVAKQYVEVAGRMVLAHTLDVFAKSTVIDVALVVIAEGDEALYAAAFSSLSASERAKFCAPVMGGATRQASVLNGLRALEVHQPDKVLIHDAARPFVTGDTLERCLDALASHKACLVASPVTDTIKQIDGAGYIAATIDRTVLWSAQTPQGFDYPFILAAHEAVSEQHDLTFTDDAAVAEWAGERVWIVEGSSKNIKLTNPEDLDMADKTMRERTSSTQQGSSAPLTDIRLGTGYDVHAFDDGDAVIIGGVSIPHDRKLKGHSDADVGLHAITDAILGAIADGDIGTHFPPSDPQWKGAPSDLFLKDAVRRVRELGGKIGNIDLTVICEAPKIGPHRPAMRTTIAGICEIAIGRVSVKATTSERLGFTGRKEGIAALASACIHLPDPDL
ncbi:bifunctional 2-C-methyl-D-erythritol 4-phosphate cytidylyltransferase/2-C-methyl-D-erythritol 2,4-cyclodiphosphate synthase [Cohaesibacter intestini]|uniref:bifunctional 2-C-methyl-D-erythritol 4-phosphate cytidylyltransferase/2-C-methyl-D-erythritol 2,4-cyclodiphosphate synthase n=1 Tax=Cohaesibacter intestini TaxID=2211145 RepID=UPI000DEA086C|nr:bifunctional 2-C-methyl-D-erythritol 4-phosphate cytidylyltransferase/2-C-methyl-D-erythritol 2,4-cyclodiphosphate synthase [Cohaesibacter intestini]